MGDTFGMGVAPHSSNQTHRGVSTDEAVETQTGETVDVAHLVRAVDRSGDYRWAGRALTFPLRRLWLNVDHQGIENVPAHGGVILAANHLAFIDSLLLMYSLPRPVSFLGKSEYLNHPVARHLFPATGMLPLDRSGKRARVTLDRADQILRGGGIVGVHPEGTRSRDGLLGPGHKGVAQMALRSGAPVVPVGLVGTGDVQPVGKMVPSLRGKITIKWGAPIGLGPWASRRRSAQSRRELTEAIMEGIAALSGQEQRASFADARPRPVFPTRSS